MNARLLLLLDTRSPAGAHNHSGGMEAAVTAGFVRDVNDVRDFCRGRLRTAGRVAAAFAGQACQSWLDQAPPRHWQELDAEFDARTPSEAMREASRSMGNGLRRLLRATVPDADLSIWDAMRPHHPLVLGAGCALTGGTSQIAARAAALATCAAPASAAVRLLGLDPYAVHTVLAELAPEIDRVLVPSRSCKIRPSQTAESCTIGELAELAADSAPALDLLADVHAAQEVRLFAS